MPRTVLSNLHDCHWTEINASLASDAKLEEVPTDAASEVNTILSHIFEMFFIVVKIT